MSDDPEARPALLALEDVVEEARFGGKAAALGAALRAGLPVPPGVALSVELTCATARGDAAARGQVMAAFARVGPPLAARSSAVGEDGAAASFAGQHATVLAVGTPAELVAAVARVHASAFAPSALGYRQRLGLSGPPRMAVVVQRLVVADVAGVLFTHDPVSGLDVRVIEATWGLGEAVVAGLVTPDHFRVARGGAILERRVGHKDLAIRPAGEGGGTREVAVPADRATTLCLGDAELRRLEALATACEATARGPQDLEWAFAGGELFLLQRRAITRTPG